MRAVFFVAALGVSSVATLAAPACTTAAPSTDLAALRAAGAPVIDVRTPEEWAGGHLDGSTLIPVQEFSGRIGEVEALVKGDKTKPVIVVCRSGNRAGTAREMLLKAGFTNVVNGGAWTNVK